MKKWILIGLSVLMLISCACAAPCQPTPDGIDNTEIIDSAELTALAASSVTKQIPATAAVYLRGGKNGDLNYEGLLKAYPVSSGKELILKRNTKEGTSDNDREIFVQYNLNDVLMNLDSLRHAYVTFSGTSRDADIGDVLVYVITEDVALSELTWNTRPMGDQVLSNYRINAMVPSDLWKCIDYALDNGMDTLTLRFVGKNTTNGEHRYSGDVQKLPRLTVTSEPLDGSVSYSVFDTAEENEALWAYAEKMFNEWSLRHQKLVEDRKNDPKAPLIQSDESQFNKIITWSEHIGWNDRYEKTRTFDALDDLSKYVDITEEQTYDKYGGLMDPEKRQKDTGFFYAKEIDGRWWIIDPLGYPCHIRSVSGITPQYSPGSGQGRAALEQYGDYEKWIIATVRRLKDGLYLNCTTANERTPEVEDTLFQVVSLASFMNSYASGMGTYAGVGGMSRFSENDTMPVFDPAFAEYSDTLAKEETAKYEGRSDILGFYTDNELPIGNDMLNNYLSLDKDKVINNVKVNAYSYACAWTWMIKMTGKDRPTEADITDELAALFQGFVWDRYLYVTTTAVRTYDQDHMLMGTKFLSGLLNSEWVCRALGTYVDCININWYGDWTPDAVKLQNLEKYARRPFMVTEFYAKAIECEGNLAHTDSGAGYLVKTQDDRGYFYQNYTLRLLESPNNVGWQWFQYIDCDPSGTQTDVSSKDSNKGIFSNTHKEYTDFTDEMIQINKNVYHLIEYFDLKYGR